MRTTDKMHSRKALASFGAAALFAVTAVAAQVAGKPFPDGAPLDASGSFQTEVAACKAGKTGEDLATCLKEARNAQADKKRGLMNEGDANYQANARARCGVLTGEDKAACEARMMGYGTVSGNVAGGGLLREVETVVMPKGQGSVTVDAKTSEPVVLVPAGSGQDLVPAQK